jgi:hypothetical protein
VPAIAAQATALAPMLIALGAAAAAVMALVAAWNQFNALDKDLEGSGGVSGTVGKMWEMGTIDPFKAHDAVMNEKATADRTEADLRDRDRDSLQFISPQERAAAANTEAAAAGPGTTVDGTITVEAKPNTKASVKAKPRKVPIVLKPSGAFT